MFNVSYTPGGGAPIHCAETDGDGPPLLLLHSSGTGAIQWFPLQRALDGARRSLAPDLPGTGRSGSWTSDSARGQSVEASLEGDLAVVAHLLEALDAPALLIGHSYGGHLALQAARRWPGRVRAVVAHEPVVWGLVRTSPDPTERAQLEAFFRAAPIFLDESAAGSEAWCAAFVDFWSGAGTWGRMIERRRAGFRASAVKVFYEVRAMCLDATTAESWAEVRCPVRLTIGQASPPMGWRAVELLASALPDVELEATPGGHMSPLTQPRQMVERWLKTIAAL